MNNTPTGIVVYGASSDRIAPEFKDAAEAVGRAIARAGVPLVNGAGAKGLMGAAIDGALAAGGSCIGVIPVFMAERGWTHHGLSDVRVTPTMHRRKELMAQLSRGAIALPGGIGTFDELCEILTWRQLKLYDGPVVILNTADYYAPFLQMLEKASADGFMRPGSENLYHVTSDPEEAVRLALGK
ncbi:MAG: TIGR00730 family Rossman fold protein [Muribaculaceae bacterium]|nr:TIGR00730 family Rossman fold protein [Muribaculaceae bacterium]